MAKKRNVYKGGNQATRPEDLFYESPLRYEWITPQLERAHSVSDKIIKSEYSRLRAIANKRIQRMEGRPEAAAGADQRPGQFPSVRGMTRHEAVQQLNKVVDFLSAKRSSISGIKKSNKKIKEALKRKGLNIPDDQIAKFGAFMNAMKKALGINRGEYGSDQLVDLWQELFDKGKISQKQFEKRIKEVMKDIEEERKKDFTRAQRMTVNSTMRDNPISDFFSEEALDPRTVAAIERRDEGREALRASRSARLGRARARRGRR